MNQIPPELQALLAGAQAGQAAAKPLPPMREDLVVSEGPRTAAGEASWLIYDPLRHRFFDIDQPTFAILSLWRAHATVEALAEAASVRLGAPFEAKEIEALAAFFAGNNLTVDAGDWRQLAASAQKRPHGLVMTLVHNYLFFRIPLVSPQRFLESTRHLVAPLFYWQVQGAILLVGLLGLHLVAKQWDEFIHEARGLATLGGIAAFGATLFVVKAFHELGHAYSAVRHGCRVPSMGLAFMMMAPLLYTDVTDAWRLKDRRKRLAIDSAGVAVELGLACIATFVWVFLPDGAARHIAFLIATTSWVMSLAINLNPFMRFDGYYMLADLLGVPNLQPRAFALGRWQLRELLFRLHAPCPEHLPPRLVATLIAYAWGVWVYRFFLFLGIAALVYTCIFKLLGIALFAFEIGYFIIKPIFGELKSWWKMRAPILASRRTYMTLGAVGVLLAVALVPWSARVAVPAVLDAGEIARVFPPRAARVAQVLAKPGDRVAKGDILVRLEQPDLDHESRTVTAKRDAIRLRLDRQSADRDDRDDKLVLESELAALSIRLGGIVLEREELTVRAPQTGTIAEFNPALQAGRWISSKEQIALITGAATAKVTGYLAEGGLWRVEPGDTGVFIPEVPTAPASQLRVATIAPGATAAIDIAELASTHGGHVEVQPDGRQRLVPTQAQYAIAMTVTGAAPSIPATQRGTALIDGRPESLLASVYRRVLKVLVRASGA